jgi:hypothetical protein
VRKGKGSPAAVSIIRIRASPAALASNAELVRGFGRGMGLPTAQWARHAAQRLPCSAKPSAAPRNVAIRSVNAKERDVDKGKHAGSPVNLRSD